MNSEDVVVEHTVTTDAEEHTGPLGSHPVGLIRKQNLMLLTERRGTKNTLTRLAGLNGSRVSLMTSGRKPVSDRFAHAIEDALKLSRGWLDHPRSADEVPGNVWILLSSSPAEAHSNIRETAASPATAPERAERRVPAPPHLQATVASGRNAASRVNPPQNHALESSRSSALFDKRSGQCGAIAEALAKTIITLSSSDRLSEFRAFELLGMLLKESEYKQ